MNEPSDLFSESEHLKRVHIVNKFAIAFERLKIPKKQNFEL